MMMTLDEIETATREDLSDELAAACEPTDDWETAEIGDLRKRVRALIRPNLEITTNTEWWSLWSPIDFDEFDEVDRDDAADDLCTAYWSNLQDAGYSVTGADKDRATLPGWQGAMFTWKGPGVGSWQEVTAEQREEIWKLLEAARVKVWGEWGVD